MVFYTGSTIPGMAGLSRCNDNEDVLKMDDTEETSGTHQVFKFRVLGNSAAAAAAGRAAVVIRCSLDLQAIANKETLNTTLTNNKHADGWPGSQVSTRAYFNA